MANKSVSVKIGADTKDFINSLKAADKQITATQRTANELQKGLKLDFNEKNFVQAQKQYQKALEQTAEKAQSIRDKLKTLEEGGKVDTADYQALELELAKTENRAISLKENLEKINKINLDNANKVFNDLSKGLENAAKKTAVISAGATAAIAGIVKLGNDAASSGAEIQDFADRLGITAETFQRYDYIALQSGVATEQLTKALSKSRDAIGTALSGTANNATKTLEKLFGTLENIPSSTEDGFAQIIEQLSKIEDSTLQAYYANELFGEKLATDLIPLINNGADKLSQLNSEFEAIGYLSNEQVQGLADFDDKLNIVRETMELTKIELGTALLPLYENLTNMLKDKIVPAIKSVADWFDGLSDHTKDVITNALLFTAALSPVLFALSKITGLIPQLLGGLNSLKAHPIIATLSVVAGLMAYLYATNEDFADSIDKLFKVLSRILSSVLKPIAKALEIVFGLLEPFINDWAKQLEVAFGAIAAALEPVAWLLEKISDLMNNTWEFIGMIFGKGWLWGKEKPQEDTASSIQTETTPNFNDYSFDLPTGNNTNTSYNNYSNDSYNIELNLNASGNLDYDARSLADEVIKQIAVKKQALGR